MVICVFNLGIVSLNHSGHFKGCIKVLGQLRVWASILCPDLTLQISLLRICLQGPAKFWDCCVMEFAALGFYFHPYFTSGFSYYSCGFCDSCSPHSRKRGPQECLLSGPLRSWNSDSHWLYYKVQMHYGQGYMLISLVCRFSKRFASLILPLSSQKSLSS